MATWTTSLPRLSVRGGGWGAPGTRWTGAGQQPPGVHRCDEDSGCSPAAGCAPQERCYATQQACDSACAVPRKPGLPVAAGVLLLLLLVAAAAAAFYLWHRRETATPG